MLVIWSFPLRLLVFSGQLLDCWPLTPDSCLLTTDYCLLESFAGIKETGGEFTFAASSLLQLAN